MKRFIALLAALTLVFGCGCGNTTDETKDNGTDNSVTDNQNGAPADQNGDGVVDNNNTVGDDIANGLDDAGNAIENGVDDAGNAIKNGVDDMTGSDTGTTDGTADTGADTTTKTANP